MGAGLLFSIVKDMMIETRNLEIILDGIRDELLRIRKILEREEQNKSMILQKVNNENSYTRLQ